jgi:hypothetical protein
MAVRVPVPETGSAAPPNVQENMSAFAGPTEAIITTDNANVPLNALSLLAVKSCYLSFKLHRTTRALYSFSSAMAWI